MPEEEGNADDVAEDDEAGDAKRETSSRGGLANKGSASWGTDLLPESSRLKEKLAVVGASEGTEEICPPAAKRPARGRRGLPPGELGSKCGCVRAGYFF